MWAFLVIHSRFSGLSFNLSPSLWCMTHPRGIDPFAWDHTHLAYSIHFFGGVLMNLLVSPCASWIRMVPIGTTLCGTTPFLNSVATDTLVPLIPLFHGTNPVLKVPDPDPPLSF
jgi:hypothetical protein